MSDQPVIRAAIPEDASAVADLFASGEDAWRFGLTREAGDAPIFSLEQAASEIIAQGATWVAVDGGHVVGFVQVRRYGSDPRHADIKRIVHGDFRRRGIGRMLLRHAENQAFSQYGVLVARLMVYADGPYGSARLGWHPDGRLRGFARNPFTGRREDMLAYSKSRDEWAAEHEPGGG